MKKHYTDEKHALILISLLKEHGIKKIITSPGTTNMPITASIDNDNFFEVFSCVDERSAAYMACGMAEESGEPVALSCTGATASRNYLPGLTEAFYRKLPVLAITSFNGNRHIGNLVAQNIDRTVLPNDVKRVSVQVPIVKDDTDAKYCNLLINKALLELRRAGGGPVHLNLTSTYEGTWTTKNLPKERVIKRWTNIDEVFLDTNRKFVIFIGAHKKFDKNLIDAIEGFCKKTNSVVMCDHTSSYNGTHKILSALICSNLSKLSEVWSDLKPDTIVHIGEVSGDYPSHKIFDDCLDVWRVSEDGEVRDFGGNLRNVFEGKEHEFFNKFTPKEGSNDYYKIWQDLDAKFRGMMPNIPFSNAWIASKSHNEIPKDSYLNLAILNSLRSWNYFPIDKSITTTSNVGGFGIDGCLSTTVGASLTDQEKLYFAVIGDLAFFYDMNVIANRHTKGNLRILLVNNGCGVEFSLSTHIGSQFGEDVTKYISAGGHFGSGNMSDSNVQKKEDRENKSLAKSWAESNGFLYIKASTKDEFLASYKSFFSEKASKSIIFECFTDPQDESVALKSFASLNISQKERFIKYLKSIIPRDLKKIAKKIVKGIN